MKSYKIYENMSNKYVFDSSSMKLQRAGNLTQIKRESRIRGNVSARFEDRGKDEALQRAGVLPIVIT